MRQLLSAPMVLVCVFFGAHIRGYAFLTDVEPAPKVYLNHFFRTVDSSTYKDIVGSDFIKNEFAHFEERTTVVNAGQSYSGAYIYGENTYFEFFDESQSQDASTMGLTSAIAFGVDKKDEIKIIQKKLKSYKNAPMAMRSREFEGIQIPWFTMAVVFHGKNMPDVMTWVMEYHEDFLKKWHPDLGPSTPGITRKHILQRYAAKTASPGLAKDKILKDVIQVNIQLKPEDLEIIKEELAVYGYAISHEGNKTSCSGPGVKIVIDPLESRKGKITGIKMSCHPHRYQGKSFQFGKSRLVFHADNTATWIF
jgi:hypothetical protein